MAHDRWLTCVALTPGHIANPPPGLAAGVLRGSGQGTRSNVRHPGTDHRPCAFWVPSYPHQAAEKVFGPRTGSDPIAKRIPAGSFSQQSLQCASFCGFTHMTVRAAPKAFQLKW